MKASIGIGGPAGRGSEHTVEFVRAADRLGVDAVWSAEAWASDAITMLAFLAAQTRRIRLGTGIMQVGARTPANTAMTALSLNALSGGRFCLGLGVSGPQVVEGLHGVDYSRPLTRLRETVEICRLAFAGEKLIYAGQAYVLPRPGGEGKPLRIDAEPAQIPIYLATLSPRSLEYTGAAADGWLGTSFSPEHADAHLAFIEKGAARAGRTLADIDLHAAVTVAIGDDVQALIDRGKPAVAFTMGAMGSATTNFYNAAFQRAGYEDDARAIQALWLEGKRKEAAERVPNGMVTEFQAVGTREMVRERFQKYKDVGIDALNLQLDAAPGPSRLDLLENVVDLIAGLD